MLFKDFTKEWFSNVRKDLLAGTVVALALIPEAIAFSIAYGHFRIRQLIIGSTTTSMVRTCQIPVLMFR